MPGRTPPSLADRFPGKVHDLPEYRQRVHVFEDREEAGAVLADLLRGREGGPAVVLAIPAGGVPVAVSLAGRLGLPLDVASVSKITLPENTEVGCGAVAFDGSVELNEPLLGRLGLGGRELRERIAETTAKVKRRHEALRAGRGALELAGREAVLVDDGLASGFTMRLAAKAVRALAARRVVVAVPTAPATSAAGLLDRADEIWCVNIRAGGPFAVADAYRNWRDVDEAEAAATLRRAWQSGPRP
jgi:predicted phosphoribosyltransferase